MHRIHGRLIVMFVVIVTVVLAVMGAYSQTKLRNQLEMQHAQLRKSVIARLQISLPSALWNLDKAKIDSLMEAEMVPLEVTAIRIYDNGNDKLFSGKMRDGNRIVSVDAHSTVDDCETCSTSAPLWYKESADNGEAGKMTPLGHVVVDFSRAEIDAALSAELTRIVAEIVLLDLILVAALSLSLRMVFVPLTQLRDSLFELAARETEDVMELRENRRDEFGEVARGFNRIQRKLKQTIAQTRQAEDAARQASDETSQALENLQKAQDSLVQAERLASLGNLVAGVAHEINTPVGITLTSASVLMEATLGIQRVMDGGNIKKSDIANYLKTAEDSSRLIVANAFRAAELIQSFKQIAVDQTNEMRRSFQLKEYIDEVVMSLHPRLKQTSIRIVVDCSTDIVLDSYPGALAQVLTNLVMNALTHAYEADSIGTIHIAATPFGDTLELIFRDDGKGIPAEYLDKIFDPFFTTRRGNGGTGLGLNIVFNLIIQQFGGVISVDSTLGQGTRFTIRLPLVAPMQEAA